MKNNKTKVFNMMLGEELRAWLDSHAKESGMSLASLIRFILLSYKRDCELTK